MPTPDGREWLTPREIITRQINSVRRDHPNVTRQQLESLRDSLEEGFRSTDYHMEFKILRLVERLKNAIDEGRFGPLTIPNTVDSEGMKIPTPVGEIHLLFRDLYTIEFLDQFDEEGEPLPSEPAGG